MGQPEEVDAHESGRVRTVQGSPRQALLSDTYRLIARLGAGSTGEVYEAEHIRLGKRVAVKMLRRELMDSPRTVERLRREARTLSELSSEFVVAVFDCGVLDDSVPFFVMERLVGADLRSILQREGALNPRRAVHLAMDACRGLSAIHASGHVHRDLKPANLFVTRRGTGEELCKVLDLGVARRLSKDTTTSRGAVIGTVRYMAPEQLADGSSVRRAADIYALGAILYECLAGVPMFQAETVEEMMFQILNATPPSLHELRPDLPRELTAITTRATERDPQRRFPSAGELLAALEASLDGKSTLDVTSRSTTVGGLGAGAARSSRHPARWHVGLLGAAALSGVATAVWFGIELRRARAAQNTALVSAASAVTSCVAEPLPVVGKAGSAERDGTRLSLVSSGAAPSPERPVPPKRSSAATGTGARTAPEATPPIASTEGAEAASALQFDSINPYSSSR